MIPKEVIEKLAYHRREVERIFTEVMVPAKKTEGLPVPADIFETDSTLVIELELPGLDAKSVEVSVSNDLLLIEGERSSDRPDSSRYHQAERSFGRFQRVIEIPCAVDTRQIRPVITRGVLRIEVPKVTDRRGQWRRVELSEGE